MHSWNIEGIKEGESIVESGITKTGDALKAD
jgi:hypothetical protein